MTNEIIKPPAQEVVAVDPMTAIMAAANNPDVDAAKLTALVELKIKMIDHQHIQDERAHKAEFQRDKHNAIANMPRITKRGEIINHKTNKLQSRYSKYADIDKVVRPIIAANNLVLTHDIGNVDGMISVTPILSHVNGYVERGGSMLLPLDTSGSKNATQGTGSSSEYGKRYTLKAMLSIIDEGADDSGGQMDIKESTSQELLLDSRTAATRGISEYETWFKALTTIQKTQLVSDGYHAENKVCATESDNR